MMSRELGVLSRVFGLGALYDRARVVGFLSKWRGKGVKGARSGWNASSQEPVQTGQQRPRLWHECTVFRDPNVGKRCRRGAEGGGGE